MRYFTKEWFAFCQMENPQPADIAKMSEASKNYHAALQGQDIPLLLQERFFDLHDCWVIGCDKQENDFVLRIENYDRNKTEIKIAFCDAKIKTQDASLDGCVWLYSELYRHDIGYEVHILFQKQNFIDLVEIIMQCRDISVTS